MAAEEPPDSTPSGPPPVLADRYVLGAVLGSGGMGQVYVARDRKLEREVAVKLLTSASPEREALRRFQREALAAGSLQHPNIVAVFDAGEEAGRPFLVTELLRGKTLRQRLLEGPLPVPEALRITRQVASGLAAAHDKGLTHRDLKPENIFVTEDGWVKILDFGLVKLAEALQTPQGADDDSASTAAGRMLGTVGYMAPEQVRGKPVDPRADLFNLGLLLHEMLSGKRAFQGGSAAEIGYATLFRPPDALPSHVPRDVRQVLGRCMEKDRDQRIGSSRELLTALEALDLRPARPRLPQPGRKLLLAALSLAAIVAIAVFAWPLRPGREPTVPVQPPSGTVAIFPFSSRDAPHFVYLGEGVVDLLGRDLEGSGLRALDSASVLRALGHDVTADLDNARRAAALLGAKYFIFGRIEERRGKLVLEAVLHTGDGGIPVTQGVAEGDPPELLNLVRKMSDQIQARTLPRQEFESRLLRLARQSSRSLPALQAWLEGEQLLRRGHWTEVLGAFQRAVSADPGFALAHYRLGVVASIIEPGLAEDALQRALRNSDRLSLPEQTLVQGRLALQQGRFADAERAFQEATRKYPDEAGTWMDLGELYFHSNPLRARSQQESVNAFQHVLVLDTLNTEAMSHLADLAQMRGERSMVAKLADRLLALTDDARWTIIYSLARSWALNDQAERDRIIAGLRTPGLDPSLAKEAFVRAQWDGEDFAAAQAIADQMSQRPAPADRSSGMFEAGLVELRRGRPDAARALIIRAAELDPSGNASFFVPFIDTLDFVAVTPAQLSAARAAAAALDLSRQPSLEAAKQYLIGALAVRAADTAAATASVRALERMPPLESSSITTDLALAVRARMLADRHDAAGALALLDKQQLRVPVRYAAAYARIAESKLRAALLEQSGRPRDALPFLDSLNIYSGTDPVLFAAFQLAKGRLFDQLGEAESAIEHYARFAALWKDCEPAQRPAAEQALARLAQLRQRKAFKSK